MENHNDPYPIGDTKLNKSEIQHSENNPDPYPIGDNSSDKPKFNSKPEINSENPYHPKCPTCGSPNVEKIPLANKVKNAVLWGVLSFAHNSKTFRCQNCDYKW